MEQRPRPYPGRGRRPSPVDFAPTPAGPAPFSPAPVGLIAVRPQPRGRIHVGVPARQLDRRKGWEQRYVRTLLASDFAVGAASGGLAYFLRFDLPVTPHTRVYVIFSLLLPFAMVLAVAAMKAYDKRFLFVGTHEYDRVIKGGLWLIATASIVSYALELPTARSYVLIALPAATAATVVARFLLRHRLHVQREQGHCLRRVIVAGHELAIIGLTRQLCRERFHGLEVVGACLPKGSDGRVGLPVYGTFDDVAEATRIAGADTVIVLSCPELDGHALRRLAWALERDEIDLIVASALIDVAGDRTTIRPVDGLPMLHVEHPRLEGGSRIVKELVDVVGAGLLIALLSPLFALVAIAIKRDSRGPILFRQTRVGRNGRRFTIFKFRTMQADAELRRRDLIHHNEHGGGVMFKMRNDPRVTRTGRWLRRYSLDELPQLFNVLSGQMSLVGPRPPLPQEVAAYADDVRRRLAVKPGMTGLWQVSGRSDLPWEEAVRLDLRYVENWSLSMDLVIMLRTLTAVARSSGAY